MSTIRRILFRTLALKQYLRLLHWSFHFLYSINYLKRNHHYKYHYFDRKLIREGLYILDIGANLGYYTVLFSRWTGSSGKVFAIEPVSAFYDTLSWATKKYKNINLINCALGEEEKEVTLATPGNFGYLRTGLPHVIQNNDQQYEFSFKAQMKRGSQLFEKLPRLDFIKCDIEGYEEIVLPEMTGLLKKFKPIIQLETWGEHKPKVENFLNGIGYETYDIEKNKLKPASQVKGQPSGDLLFIHKENNFIIEKLKSMRCA